MPAHSRRRFFSASVVVTIAALPACSPDAPAVQPSPTPLATGAPLAAHDAGAPAAHDAGAPPAADAPPAKAPPTAFETRSWHGWKDASGCTLAYPDQCPPTMNCNPPKPRSWPCPKELGPDVTSFTIVPAEDGKTCTLDASERAKSPPCPPGMRCNPPPPRTIHAAIDCPK